MWRSDDISSCDRLPPHGRFPEILEDAFAIDQVATLEACIEEVRNMKPEPLNRNLVGMAEILGIAAGPQMFSAHMAEHVAAAIVRFSRVDLPRAAVLMARLFSAIVQIEIIADKAHALAGMIGECAKAPREFHAAIVEVYSALLKHCHDLVFAEREHYDPRVYDSVLRVYDALIKAWCELDIPDVAESIWKIRTEVSSEGANWASLPIGVARRKKEAGELSLFEREYLGDRDAYVRWALLIQCKAEAAGQGILDSFVETLVSGEESASRANLLKNRLRDLLLPAVATGGMDLALRIIAEIEAFDDRFERAGELLNSYTPPAGKCG